MGETYKQIKLSVPLAKARKLAAGKAVNLTAAEVRGTEDTLFVHPANFEKLSKAKRAGRGTRLTMASGEIMHDLEQLQGGSFWSWLKGAAKTVGRFAKQNYDVIKPVLSRVADSAVPALATAFGQPELAAPARGALKQLTGVGVTHGKLVKGSAEAKAHMAAIRAKRTGGSFRLD